MDTSEVVPHYYAQMLPPRRSPLRLSPKPMRVLRTALILAACSAVTAMTSIAVDGRVHVAEWSATVSGKDGRKVSGMATARPTADGTGTEVAVTLDGDTPGATRPWHIHTGSCAQSGGVVGGGRAYAPMAIDAKGHAAAKATLAVALADTGSYYVNIHDAAAAMGIIVACGDLKKK